jgi:Uncharacterized protein conserved in bacteria (DUF2334)
MTKPSSIIYRNNLTSVEKRLTAAIDKGCSKSSTTPTVFFRADDIGIPSKQFSQLIVSFKKHKMPLCLATVPTWLNPNRLKDLQQLTGDSKSLWCWHQHGYVHHNFELEGKNQEFGPARTYSEITSSLEKGKHRLDLLLGVLNQPVFTPPWNRCSSDALQALQDLNFRAISRSRNAKPPTKTAFPDFQVNVDLHTRKEQSPDLGFNNLLTELEESLATGRCGVMLHHQRMNHRAVHLLDTLLSCLQKKTGISFVHFGDLLS